MAEIDAPSLSIGQVFQTASGAMRAAPATIFAVPFVVDGVARILNLALMGTWPGSVPPGPDNANTSLPGLLALCLILGCIVHATVGFADDRRDSLVDCLKLASKRLFPLLGVIILYFLAVMFSALFLIVPGLMVMVLWGVVIPVIVEERPGVFGAFGRAQDLTRGARWRLLGLFLLLILMGIGIGAVFALLSRLILGAPYTDPAFETRPGTILIATLDDTILYALWGTLLAAAFVGLRNAREGSPQSRLSEIFA